MDPGRKVSFEKDCSSKAAAVLEQMKEILRRSGQRDDLEVRERERERVLNFFIFVDLPSRVRDWLPFSPCGIFCSGGGAGNG